MKIGAMYRATCEQYEKTSGGVNAEATIMPAMKKTFAYQKPWWR